MSVPPKEHSEAASTGGWTLLDWFALNAVDYGDGDDAGRYAFVVCWYVGEQLQERSSETLNGSPVFKV